jgi:hypothetical protein
MSVSSAFSLADFGCRSPRLALSTASSAIALTVVARLVDRLLELRDDLFVRASSRRPSPDAVVIVAHEATHTAFVSVMRRGIQGAGAARRKGDHTILCIFVSFRIEQCRFVGSGTRCDQAASPLRIAPGA